MNIIIHSVVFYYILCNCLLINSHNMGCSSSKQIKVIVVESTTNIPSDTFYLSVKSNASSSEIGNVLYSRITGILHSNNPLYYDIKITFQVGGITTSNFKLLNKTQLIYVNLIPKIKV